MALTPGGDDHSTLGMIKGTVKAIAVLAALALPATAEAVTLVSVNAGGGVLRVRPVRIHLVSNENLGELKWRNWGGTNARGNGTSYANGPSPHHSATNPVTVELLDRRQCGAHFLYTTIRLHFTAGVPYSGMHKTVTYRYGCPRLPGPE